MKKLIAAVVPMVLLLSACATGTTSTTPSSNAGVGTGLAMMAVKVGIQAKCVSEINNNTYWKTGSKLLTESKKNELQTEVCSCVGEKATTSITAADLIVAAMDKTSQANLVSRVVSNSLNACVVEKLKI